MKHLPVDFMIVDKSLSAYNCTNHFFNSVSYVSVKLLYLGSE